MSVRTVRTCGTADIHESFVQNLYFTGYAVKPSTCKHVCEFSMLIWPPPLNDFHENLTRVISVKTDRQNRKEKISTDKKKNHLKILLQAVKKKKG